MTGSWIDSNRVVSAPPGPRDSFMVTLADGKRIDVSMADRYEEVLARATVLAQQTKLAVKVLPMTATELVNSVGIEPQDTTEGQLGERDLRLEATEMLRAAMIEAPDQSTRVEARDLIRSMEALR